MGDLAAAAEVMELTEPERTKDMEWPVYRYLFDRFASAVDEWQGIPLPLPGQRLVLETRHPMRGLIDKLERATTEERSFTCSTADVAEDPLIIRNRWWSWSKNAWINVVQEHGKIRAVVDRVAPDHSMEKLRMGMMTMGCADAWTLEAEYRARDNLKALLSERQWQMYELTGSFLESSERSGVMYWFRRLRPTVALVNDPKIESMRCLAVMCFHSIGYYAETFAGALVPSDDVASHLIFMRGDEAGYWRVANQHKPDSAEAGL